MRRRTEAKGPETTMVTLSSTGPRNQSQHGAARLASTKLVVIDTVRTHPCKTLEEPVFRQSRVWAQHQQGRPQFVTVCPTHLIPEQALCSRPPKLLVNPSGRDSLASQLLVESPQSGSEVGGRRSPASLTRPPHLLVQGLIFFILHRINVSAQQDVRPAYQIPMGIAVRVGAQSRWGKGQGCNETYM